MSDFNSSLPTRTESNGDIVGRLVDGTVTTQFLGIDASGRITIKLDDGSGNLITSQVNGTQRALDVGINVAGVQIDPRSIRALTSSDVVTANQGSAAATASAWPIKLTDGTNISAVKAASTAALAADPALVVTFSPNSPLPTGSNVIGSVNQGTSPWVTKDQSDGPVTPGTVASFSQLTGGQYNSTLPTLTTGQQAALQVDSSGRLITVDTDPNDHNYGTVGSNTLRTAAQIGNTGGAADFAAGATSAQTLRTVSNQGTAGAAAWLTTDAANGSVGAGTAGTKSMLSGGIYNSTLPTLTTGQQAGLQVDSSGRLIIAPQTDTDALAQGATTSGQLGSLVMGAVTTAAPAYTTAQTSPLSLTTTGLLRVDGSGVTQPISGTVAVTQSTSPWVVSGTVTSNQGTANATPWNENVAQFGGSAVVTGTGTSGAGIPRVTVSSDSSILANIQVAGSAVSSSNPVPVSISSTTPGTPVQNYNTATVAANASSTHVYTVTALKTLNLARLWATSSGKLKVELQVETGVATGVFNTRFVGFNSTATPNIDITIVSALAVAAGVRVQVIRTNLDKASDDVYSTLEGTEV